MIGRADIWFKEELTSVLVGPVIWNGVAFFFIGLDPRNKGFKVAVLADEFQGRMGADFGDWVKVIAAEKNAEIYKLRTCVNIQLSRAFEMGMWWDDKAFLLVCDPYLILQGLSPSSLLE